MICPSLTLAIMKRVNKTLPSLISHNTLSITSVSFLKRKINVQTYNDELGIKVAISLVAIGLFTDLFFLPLGIQRR